MDKLPAVLFTPGVTECQPYTRSPSSSGLSWPLAAALLGHGPFPAEAAQRSRFRYPVGWGVLHGALGPPLGTLPMRRKSCERKSVSESGRCHRQVLSGPVEHESVMSRVNLRCRGWSGASGAPTGSHEYLQPSGA